MVDCFEHEWISVVVLGLASITALESVSKTIGRIVVSEHRGILGEELASVRSKIIHGRRSQGRLGINRKRARLIARDQAASLNGTITRVRWLTMWGSLCEQE